MRFLKPKFIKLEFYAKLGKKNQIHGQAPLRGRLGESFLMRHLNYLNVAREALGAHGRGEPHCSLLALSRPLCFAALNNCCAPPHLPRLRGRIFSGCSRSHLAGWTPPASHNSDRHLLPCTLSIPGSWPIPSCPVPENLLAGLPCLLHHSLDQGKSSIPAWDTALPHVYLTVSRSSPLEMTPAARMMPTEPECPLPLREWHIVLSISL